MKRALAISVIALVAVVMGLSAISPMIQYADARHGGSLTEKACDALQSIPNPPSEVEQIIADHCADPVPPGGF